MNRSAYQAPKQCIIRSLLDDDIYKFYMQQPMVNRYMDTHVRMKFLCRDSEDLLPYINTIREQIEMVGDLYITQDQLHFLSHSIPDLKHAYIYGYLRMFRMFPSDVRVFQENGLLAIEASGLWASETKWEIFIMAIVSEVRNSIRYPEVTLDDVRKQLDAKVKKFYQLAHDQKVNLEDFRVADFGTRRRLSFNAQFEVVEYLKTAMKDHFVGTSNVHIARELNVKAIGTQAHEWYQAHQAIKGVRLVDSQKAALQAWADEYRGNLGIALTDCISMDAFLTDFDLYFASLFSGLRHDSGLPMPWGDKAVNHYNKLKIDPMTKVLVFSDGLKLDQSVLDIYKHFYKRIHTSNGIGTNFTCDVPGVKPMSMVMKLIEVNGQPVAKLSDSPGKTMCKDETFIANLMRTFNYNVAGESK
jgi:nicotinate phosphoribosyltransferase